MIRESVLCPFSKARDKMMRLDNSKQALMLVDWIKNQGFEV